MFFPVRHAGYAIYDLRRLVLPRTVLEERIFLEATRRIPATFAVGSPWGDEQRDGALWIDEAVHDRYYKEIRSRLRADAAYVRSLSNQMVVDIERLGAETRRRQESPSVGETAWNPEELLDGCAQAVSWFATNWLHPFGALRMAVVRLLGEANLDGHMQVLLRGEAPPIFLQAYVALSGVRDGSISDTDFRQSWGPLYADGDEPGLLAEPGATATVAAAAPSAHDQIRLAKETDRRSRERQELVLRLLEAARRLDGPTTADLLEAQLEFISRTIWQEETRRLHQQQSYALCRAWLREAPDDARSLVATRLPWAAKAFTTAAKGNEVPCELP